MRAARALGLAAALAAATGCRIDDVTFLPDAPITDGAPGDAVGTGVAIVVSNLDMNVAEGDKSTFTVALGAAPAEALLVTLTPSDDSKVGVTPTALLFSGSDWSTQREITVLGKEDIDASNDLAAVDLTSTAIAAGVTVNVQIADNDTLAITAAPATMVDVDEGGTATVAVRLSARPDADTAVAVSSTDPAIATAAPAGLTFTQADWDVAQLVTIGGVDDVDIVTETASLQLTATGVADTLVGVQVVDDDVLGIDPSTTSITSFPEGAQRTFTVRLTQLPPGNVTVGVASTDPGAATATPATLDFTTADWNTPQTVTVDSAQDLDTVDETAAVTLTASGLTTRTVAFGVTDDDVQAIVANPDPVVVPEGATRSLNVHLAYQPTADVTVTVNALAAAVATASPTTLTFTAANYAANQTVTVTGTDDLDAADGATAIRLEDSADALVTDAPVTVGDDDQLLIEVAPPTVQLSEAGSAAFQVRLTALPLTPVMVSVTSGSTSAAQVSPAVLNFDATNWDVYSSVTVDGVADADLANENVTIALAGTGVPAAAVTAMVTDDDTQAVIASTGAITVPEAGGGTVGVSLQFQPAGNVIVSATSMNTAVATVGPGSLTFTPANYATPQSVAISGVNDVNAADGSTSVSLTAPGATAANVAVTVADDDILAIEADPSVNVSEGLSTTFRVRLTAQPAASTVVMVASTDTSAATVAPGSLTFSTANWNVNQVVTVTGVDDADAADDVATAILSSSGLANVNVTLNVVDNDTQAIIASTGSVAVTESGANATFGVRLSAMPAGNVVVSVSSGDASAATAAPASLTFTPTDWATNQQVTVAAPADLDVDSEVISITLASAGLANRVVAAAVTDDDTEEVLIAPASRTIGEGATSTFNVTLRYIPTATTTVTVASSNPAAVTVTPATLMFTPAGYATPQLITVTGVQDADTVNASATITGSAAGATSGTAGVTVVDDDTLGIESDQPKVNVPEYSTATFKVRLTAQPTADTIVTLGSSDPGAATVSPVSMTFNAGNWDVSQSVTVFGVADADVVHEAVTINLTSPGLAPQQVAVSVADDDLISVTPTGLFLCEGQSATVSVSLLGPPFTPPMTTLGISKNNAYVTLSPPAMTFTTIDYANPQGLDVFAPYGVGTRSSVITVAGPLLTSRTVAVTIRDDSHSACVCVDPPVDPMARRSGTGSTPKPGPLGQVICQVKPRR